MKLVEKRYDRWIELIYLPLLTYSSVQDPGGPASFSTHARSNATAGYSVRSEQDGNWIATSALGLPIPGGRCSIVVSIPACHAGDPGSIPGNGASCLAIVMSLPEGLYPRSQSAGYSVRSEREGNWIATSALGLPIP